MAWIYLIVGGLFEVGFTFCMKKSDGFALEKWPWILGFCISVSISMGLLALASRSLPIGTCYGIWAGIGAVGTVLMGIFVFGESADLWRIFFICTLIGSILGLKLVSA